MRKVGVICLFAFLTTSVFAQVTVNVKQQTIKQALRSIEKVTDYRFFYSNQLPDLDKKVTFEVNNQSIEATMSKLLSGTGLVYEKKEDNQIYLGIKESKSGQKENKKIYLSKGQRLVRLLTLTEISAWMQCRPRHCSYPI